MPALSSPRRESLHPRRAPQDTHFLGGDTGGGLCANDLAFQWHEESAFGTPRDQVEREALARRNLAPLPNRKEEPPPDLTDQPILCDEEREGEYGHAGSRHNPALPDLRSEPSRRSGGREGAMAVRWHVQLASMQPALMRTAKARLRNQEWAADAVSLVMVAAIEQPPPFEEPGRVKAWLLGILRHKLVDVLRQQDPKRVQHYGLDPEAPDDGVPVGALTDARAGPERNLAGRRFLKDLDAALAQLPPLHRRAFWLQEVLGEATGPTCDALGISPNYLGVCVHRARARLREMLVVHAG